MAMPDYSAANRVPQTIGYEFSEEENDLIASLSRAMRFVGSFAMFWAVLSVIVSIGVIAYKFRVKGDLTIDPTGWIAVIGYWLIGTWTRRAAASFTQVEKSRGHDIPWLMDALRHLRGVYGLIRLLLLVLIVIGAAILALGFYGWQRGWNSFELFGIHL